jgi:hypothetical protein
VQLKTGTRIFKRFDITIVFGDREFDPRDVNQCRADRPPARISLMRRNDVEGRRHIR